MLGFGSEFWAAIVGAIVGGLISAFLQLVSNRSATRERKRGERQTQLALARTMLFKLVKIESDFSNLRKHVDECAAHAAADRLEFGWATFLPLANFPRPVFFTPDEMGVLIQLNNEDLFNDIIAMDEVHAGLIEALQLYRTRRLELSDQLPAVMEGTKGTSKVSEDDFRLLAPKIAQLDQLAHDISNMVRAEATEPLALSTRLVATINRRFSTHIQLVPLASQPPAQVQPHS